MLIECLPSLTRPSLNALIDRLEPTDLMSFGPDIDEAHAVLLDPARGVEERAAAFLDWAGRHQPCLFGRLGARGMKGIGLDLCWLDERDLLLGEVHLADKIQRARRTWKDRAAAGMAHGFVVVFNSPRLAMARASEALIEVCRRLCDLYLVEHAPVETDVIYTEAMPLATDTGMTLFKGGINVFYTTAHRTLNHDRRVPGGIAISTNSPGHLANSLVKRGMAADLRDAVGTIRDLAMRSIGNGGSGHDATASCSWHNQEKDPAVLAQRCPVKHLPHYVPQDYSPHSYSALYHTDVLIPELVSADSRVDPDRTFAETWRDLNIAYITHEPAPPDSINYALFNGHPIPAEARYHNPWSPRRAVNAGDHS